MKVLVVGSIREDADVATRSAFEEACSQLGKALVLAQVEIVLGSDAEHTADRYVLVGAASSPAKKKHRVLILRPESERSPSAERVAGMPDALEIIYKRTRGTWSYASGKVILKQPEAAVRIVST